MPICPYCIHIWIDFNEDMYIPTVLLKPSYVYYSYMHNPHVNLPLNFKWSWLKPHPVNSGRDPACMYVCMYACVYIIYTWMVGPWCWSWSSLVLRPCFWSIISVSGLSCTTRCAVQFHDVYIECHIFLPFPLKLWKWKHSMRCLSGFSLRCFIKSLWREMVYTVIK